MKNNILQKQKNIQVLIWLVTLVVTVFIVSFLAFLGFDKVMADDVNDNETPHLDVVGGEHSIYVSWTAKNNIQNYQLSRYYRCNNGSESKKPKSIMDYLLPTVYGQSLQDVCEDNVVEINNTNTEYLDNNNILNDRIYFYKLRYEDNNGLLVSYLTSSDVITNSQIDLYGKIFFDFDADGVKDDIREPYLENIKITLKDLDGVEVDSTITNQNGFYQFSSCSIGVSYDIDINPKILLENGLPDPAEYNNLYVQDNISTNIDVDGKRIDVGILSLNIDKEGTWGNDLRVDSGDLAKFFEERGVGMIHNNIDLNRNGYIDSDDILQILDSRYFGFPNNQ